MRTLVFGAAGLLGSNIIRWGQTHGHDVIGAYHETVPKQDIQVEQCDIRRREQVEKAINKINPSVVFNCAALTDVDACENNQRKAVEINADGPAHIAAVCDSKNIPFVHFSTDYVFDGKDSQYDESATPNPLQEYGKTKLAGERAVRETHENYIISRLSFVYGTHRGTGQLEGFPAWVREKLIAEEKVPLFVDQQITPSRAGQVAETAFSLLNEEYKGTVNIACRSCVTPYEFGERIADMMSTEGSFEQTKMEELEREAQRPMKTCLSIDRVEEVLGRPQPALVEDLRAIADAFDG